MKKHLLHIASFKGNVGDIINHEGFYNKLRSQIDFDIEQIEIRKFYRNAGELNFDSELVKKINEYDGLVIGGGGLFDIRWNDSLTGTTVDMSR